MEEIKKKRLSQKEKIKRIKEQNDKQDIKYFLENIKDVISYSDRSYYLKLMKIYHTDEYIKTFISDEEFERHFYSPCKKSIDEVKDWLESVLVVKGDNICKIHLSKTELIDRYMKDKNLKLDSKTLLDNMKKLGYKDRYRKDTAKKGYGRGIYKGLQLI